MSCSGDFAFEGRVNLLSGLSQKNEALTFNFQPQTSSLEETGWAWQWKGRLPCDHRPGPSAHWVLALLPLCLVGPVSLPRAPSLPASFIKQPLPVLQALVSPPLLEHAWYTLLWAPVPTLSITRSLYPLLSRLGELPVCGLSTSNRRQDTVDE